MALELNSLRKAVDALERAVRVAQVEIKGAVDTDREEVIRAGVIQNFELTFELCWKFMKRWLEGNALPANVDGLTMKELFRMAAEKELIADVEPWFVYHRNRNKTSHTYEPSTANEVYESTVRFLGEAQRLLRNLESKND